MESDIRRSRTCERCRTVVPLEKVKLYPRDKETNALVCEQCCEELKRPKTVSKPTLTAASRYENYRCLRCNYPFRVNVNKLGAQYNLNCPYCGKDDQLQKT